MLPGIGGSALEATLKDRKNRCVCGGVLSRGAM